MKLPPPPEPMEFTYPPHLSMAPRIGREFTSAQMHAYGAACWRAAAEACAWACLVPYECRTPHCGAGCDEEYGGCQSDIANDEWQQNYEYAAKECARACTKVGEGA
jgi:hypothetical protein